MKEHETNLTDGHSTNTSLSIFKSPTETPYIKESNSRETVKKSNSAVKPQESSVEDNDKTRNASSKPVTRGPGLDIVPAPTHSNLGLKTIKTETFNPVTRLPGDLETPENGLSMVINEDGELAYPIDKPPRPLHHSEGRSSGMNARTMKEAKARGFKNDFARHQYPVDISGRGSVPAIGGYSIHHIPEVDEHEERGAGSKSNTHHSRDVSPVKAKHLSKLHLSHQVTGDLATVMSDMVN